MKSIKASKHTEVIEHGFKVSRPEFSRPVEIIADVGTGVKRQSMAGTQTLDSEWRRLKECLPRGSSGRTQASRQRPEIKVRAMQWRRMTRGFDPWQSFCEAAKEWMTAQPKPGDSFRLPCRLEASSCCDRHVVARAAVLPTRVQQAKREQVAEEEVPGSPLDGPAETFRRGL